MRSKQEQQSGYIIRRTKQFRRDVRWLLKTGRYDISKLEKVIALLQSGGKLPPELRNHKLHGQYGGYEECRVEPDWLMVYRREERELILILARTGRHTDVFEE